MTKRISPFWWPALGIASPILLPALWIRNRQFNKDISKVRRLNQNRINMAGTIDLPELEYLKLTALVEEEASPGFKGAPGVSYKIKTDKGALLFDIGFGTEDPSFEHNVKKLGFKLDQVDALVISHLHPDHMGGFKAVRKNRLIMPETLGNPNGMPCFLPKPAKTIAFTPEIVDDPRLLTAGIASTGPLARSLFLMGRTDEQAIVARLKGKGIVVITGCGHPSIKKILQMVAVMTKEPVYAVCGGFHLPVTDSPLKKPGLKVQMIFGTGKPPWKQITDEDLNKTIEVLNQSGIQKVLLSRHDSCEHSSDRMHKELDAEVCLLRAGAEYVL